MSHFSTLVITKLHDQNDYDEITSRVEEKLAPYYEGLEVEPYIAYTIDEVRTEIDRNAREFHKQQTEKSKPGKWCIINKFPCSTPDDVDNAIDAVLQASENGDNELLSAIWYDWHGTKLDKNGNSLTTYNPDSKWDWYQIGGRWCGCIPNDACPVRDLPDDIDDIVFVPEVGALYYGRVVRLMTFGAFVELAPGKDGLVHISKLADHRIEKVEDACKIGDMMWVKVTEIDEKGRVNLSHKDAMKEIKAKEAAGEPIK